MHECRALVPELEGAGSDPESVSAHAERLLYYALVGAIEAGLVRTAEDALTVLRQASRPTRADGRGLARAAGAAAGQRMKAGGAGKLPRLGLRGDEEWLGQVPV